MGRKPQLWHDPAGRFSIDLPVGWEAPKKPPGAPVTPEASEAAVVTFVRYHSDTGLGAQLQVEIRPLPPGVSANHLDAHVQAENARRAPGYRVHDTAPRALSGVPAIQTLLSYRARGNAELGREVVQTVLVVGERGFILTFETLLGYRALFAEELDILLDGFSARGPGREVRPEPGKRRRVRAGEMINPDAVGY